MEPFFAVIPIAVILTAIITLAAILRTGRGSCADVSWIVLLGTTVRGSAPSPILRQRIETAYAYLTAHPDTVCIVFGGKGDEYNLSEAQCMFNELTVMGIESNRIRMENRASTTRENFQFSLALIEEETGTRPASIGIVSSEHHLFRAKMFAREQNVTAVTIPAQTRGFAALAGCLLREKVLVWYFATIGKAHK